MRDRPDGFDEGLLLPALREAWGIRAGGLDYAPVGFGDYHWVAGGRWFVTVADLGRRSHDGLRLALETARALRERAGLGFVVAPLSTRDGAVLVRLGRHAVSVFPYEEGVPGDFGDARPPAERERLIDLLAALHRTPPPASTPRAPAGLAGRGPLEAALRESGRPWRGGPYAEPARELVARHAAVLRRCLTRLDTMSGTFGTSGGLVVTHGEPHPGNLLRAPGGRLLLVDWDTVGLAVPERDLWHLSPTPDDLARYAAATGRRPDRDLLASYRLRWALDDVADFVSWFRASHGDTPDTRQGWAGLKGTVEELAAG
ncbi:phosphotransferase enzyme family protein [Nonomuraea sp. NPDC050783]|uniref:phosphotransferase enzyme family protein n=1 Tax=Nonomuraea sp. NPDC050783 TaxID=3154634 RepID=UPI003464F9AF